MKKIHALRWMPYALMVVLVPIMISACGGGNDTSPNELNISTLKGASWQDYVGQEVVVEGFFVLDPIPMLVNDLDDLLINAPMPETEFILLQGNELEKLSAEDYGGAKMRIDATVKAVDPEVTSEQQVVLEISAAARLSRDIYYAPFIAHIDFEHLFTLENRYAVLFSGGINAAKNYVRYWNDLKFMYATLVETYGFDPDNITVLYANGTGRDLDMPVDDSATQAHLEDAFDNLKEVADSNDKIFVFITNHGGGFYEDETMPHWYGGRNDTSGDEGNEGISEAAWGLDFNGDMSTDDTVSWDESILSWGSSIYDDAFLDMFDEDLDYGELIVVMEQCFSGGLILDMASGGDDRIIMAAAGQYEPSWAMGPTYIYDEFSYYFTCAINWADPDGNAVDADVDNDNIVTMVEAFNYAVANDTAGETPQYEDSGDGVPHSGAMPSGGDGAFGDNVSLD